MPKMTIYTDGGVHNNPPTDKKLLAVSAYFMEFEDGSTFSEVKILRNLKDKMHVVQMSEAIAIYLSLRHLLTCDPVLISDTKATLYTDSEEMYTSLKTVKTPIKKEVKNKFLKRHPDWDYTVILKKCAVLINQIKRKFNLTIRIEQLPRRSDYGSKLADNLCNWALDTYEGYFELKYCDITDLIRSHTKSGD
jgi:ribonuclease HI